MRFAAVVLLVVGSGAGCADLIPVPEIRHDIKDIKRKSLAKKWAGTYTFSECATAPPPDESSPPCWRYVFAVDQDADAVVSVDGPQPPPPLKATARVYVEGRLDFRFSSYVDEKISLTDTGINVFEPLRGRFTPGQPLAFITHDGSGRPCLTFDGMSSKLGTKILCAAPAAPAVP